MAVPASHTVSTTPRPLSSPNRPVVAINGLHLLEARRLLSHFVGANPADLDVLPPPPVGAAIVQAAEVAAAKVPLTSIPALNSHPGAPATLFLDFGGANIPTWGGYNPGITPALDQDNDPTTFSDAEIQTIRDSWAAVAEDYSPFNINVTTVDPGNRTDRKTQCIVIGGTGAWYGSAGGVSYIGSFSNSDPNTGFVFLNSNANFIGAAAAHEAGHGFGLQHQSSYDANGVRTDEYSHGDQVDSPIMGYGYTSRNVWWKGPTSISVDDIQDDMAVIASAANGFGYRPDDHTNSPASGGALTQQAGSGSTIQLGGSGVIEQATDQDWFTFTVPSSASVSMKIDVAPQFADLNARLELRSSSGATLVGAADSSALGELLTTTLAAGTYRLGVMSHHQPTSGGGFITRVGDVGQYSVHVSVTPSAPAQSPFKGSPFSIAATGTTTIQAEDFDLGGEGIAYHDTTSTNIGGSYRTSEGVDIKTAVDAGGGYRLSDVVIGEWVEYTINVAQAGNYDLGFRVANPDPGAKFHAEIDGANVTGSLNVPDTNGYSTFATVSKSAVALTAGTHVLRLAFDAVATPASVAGAFNWISLTKSGSSSQFIVGTSAASYARDGTFAGNNFGTESALVVKNSPYTSFSRQAYIKFDLSAVNSFSSAKLRLFGQTEDAATKNLAVGIFALTDPLAAWSETGLTWNNRPTSSSTSLATGTIADNTLRAYDFDLTTFLKAQRAAGRTSVTLVIKMLSPQSKFVQFSSDEAATGGPQLIFTS